jgi:hypothetical protein
MKFDEYGYPYPNGATDSEDSSHLAGVLAITKHPQAVDCERYIFTREIVENDFIISSLPTRVILKNYYRRCINPKYDLSRDQAWLLMVALLLQGKNDLVRTEFINGKDIIYPSLKGVEAIAKRGKPYFWQYYWAKLEVYIHAKFQPLKEPFQTIAACEVYDLYEFWTKHNEFWRDSIRAYFAGLSNDSFMMSFKQSSLLRGLMLVQYARKPDGYWRNEPELAEHIIRYVESKI